jgi:geranylgeranyl pyrophosphate synthase
MSDANRRIRRWQERFESRLALSLETDRETPEFLQRAMAYSLLAGGKRMRPMLVYATCDALDLDYKQLDSVACAIEIIHTYSLIHDDLPAMDDDNFRRGRPTCHQAFDEATAILAGDALQALAFEILAGDPVLFAQPKQQLRVIRDIAVACGVSGMAGGQVLDLAAVGNELSHQELTNMHQLKTGALITASVTVPTHFSDAGPELVNRLRKFGECVGLGFQIHDDILDVTGTSEKTGKSTQKDAQLEKPTFPGVMGLEESRAQAYQLRDRALAELQGFPGDCSALSWLATFAVDRDN